MGLTIADMSCDKYATLTVFDMQRGSYHDGPGMRTTVFLKGCNLRCFWCQNPESQSCKPELMYFSKKCISCFSCIDACPMRALRIENDMVIINRNACKACGKCEGICPCGALKIAGKQLSVEKILEEVCLDVPFYEISGGGMTVSGGEPLMHEEVLCLLREAKRIGIDTAVETAGNISKDTLARSVDVIDHYLFDIKCMSEDRHRKFCGSANEKILDNLKFLAERGVDVTVRVPVIPGVNDDVDELRKIYIFSKQLGLKAPELLRFNKLGKSKYDALGRKYFAEELPLYDEARWKNIIYSIK